MQTQNPIKKKILKNGLTLLVQENTSLPEVACHIFYNVGSKHETENKRGLAHAVEHLILRGTKNLSETDFMRSIFKITGSFNAFTTKDYTQFLCSIPNTQIREFFMLAQEIMSSVIFKADILDAEIRALVQEASIAQDNYDQILREELTSTIFKEHAYHYPTRGNKFDIDQFTPEDLNNFYNTHYKPHNAVLVCVGAVDAQTIFNLADLFLSNIPGTVSEQTPLEYYKRDTVSRSTVLYRNIATPRIKLAYIVPGTRTDQKNIELLCYILAQNKSSRLYQKLVIEQELVELIDANHSNLHEPNLIYIVFKPRDIHKIASIIDTIQNEIMQLAKHISPEEIKTALLAYTKNYYVQTQDITRMAELIGETFLTNTSVHMAENRELLIPPLDHPETIEHVAKQLKQLLTHYFQPFSMHTGITLPFDQETKKWWRLFQHIDDEHDAAIFAAHNRVTRLEPERLTPHIPSQQLPRFNCPVPITCELANGLQILYFDSKKSPTITIIIQLNLDHQYDPENYCGISNLLKLLLSQDPQTADFEKMGVSINCDDFGLQISLLTDSLEPALQAIQKILIHPDFSEHQVTRLKQHALYKIKEFWTTPYLFGEQLIIQKLYPNQPFSKNYMGTPEDINRITQSNLLDLYRTCIAPANTRIALVGDLQQYQVENLFQKYFGSWQAVQTRDISALIYQRLSLVHAETIDYYFDQSLVNLIIAARSIPVTDPHLDKLLIFDQYFTGSYQRNNLSELFKIRDHLGIFYTFDGTLSRFVGGSQAMLYVHSQTLLISAQQAEDAIKKALNQAPDNFGKPEFEQARNALIFSFIGQFETDESLAKTFLSFGPGLHKDSYKQRQEELQAITLEQVQETVRQNLKVNSLVTLKIGRVNNQKCNYEMA